MALRRPVCDQQRALRLRAVAERIAQEHFLIALHHDVEAQNQNETGKYGEQCGPGRSHEQPALDRVWAANEFKRQINRNDRHDKEHPDNPCDNGPPSHVAGALRELGVP